MNYSEMSDFEINKAVAEIIFSGLKITNFAGEAVVWDEKNNTRIVRYCNSWTDAGPIILANKITISAPMEYDQPADWLAYPASDSDICVSHPNPLRAAMTAFLVMQESKNA